MAAERLGGQRHSNRSRSNKRCLVLTLFTFIISVYYNGIFQRSTLLQAEQHHQRPLAAQKHEFEPLSCPRFLAQPLALPDPNKGARIIKETKTDPKFRISLHNKEFDPNRWCIYENGQYYETKLTELIQGTLRKNPNAVFLDVGGNIGWFSLLALAERREVVAFEPHPLNYLRFCQSVVENGWEDRKLSFFPYGVGDIHGDVLTLSPKDGLNPGGFSFKDNTNIRQHGEGTDNSNLNVTIVTLDAIAEGNQWFEKDNEAVIAFMKMDVEGFEANVLRGATRLLEAKKISLIELEYKVVGSRSEEENEPIGILVAHGYCIRMLGGHLGPDVEYNGRIPRMDENLAANLAAIATSNNPNLNLVFGCCDC